MSKKMKIKTKLSITNHVFSHGTNDVCLAYYEENYKDFGWKYNSEREEIYKIINSAIYLNHDEFFDTLWIVTHKSFNIEEEENCGYYVYELESI